MENKSWETLDLDLILVLEFLDEVMHLGTLGWEDILMDSFQSDPGCLLLFYLIEIKLFHLEQF